MADQKENSIVTVKLSGSIDSSNAGETEKNILAQLGGSADEVVLDMEDLRYISSAGLRIILHLRRSHPKLRIINAGSEVYDILEMTGFTEMVTVEKAYRRVSVEGCEVIGEGYNGVVYRLDRDTAVKVLFSGRSKSTSFTKPKSGFPSRRNSTRMPLRIC